MRLLLLVLLGIVAPPDDVSKAVERLASDHVGERNAAAQALERLGPAGLERLERERDGATDPEVRGHLAQIVARIRKREEFETVLGPIERVSLRARGRPAVEVAAALERSLSDRIVFEGLDPLKPVDLELTDATAWQALDAFAKALGARFETGHDRVVFRRGIPDALPVVHSGQFRVAAADVQKLDYRTLGDAASLVVLTLELRYQRNVTPLENTLRDCFQIDSVTDARGNEVLGFQPSWANCMSYGGVPRSRIAPVFVQGDAVGPLTVRGTAALGFPYERKELVVPLAGDDAVKVREGEYLLEVTSGSIKGTGPADLRSRVGPGPVRVLDEAGESHRLRSTGGGGGRTSWTWSFGARGRIEKPKAMIIPWISEIRWVEIPFRFEGIPIP